MVEVKWASSVGVAKGDFCLKRWVRKTVLP